MNDSKSTKSPIAVRQLVLGSREIEIRVFAPFQEADGAWTCKVEIGGRSEEVESTRVRGVDSFQALSNAIAAPRRVLRNSLEQLLRPAGHFHGLPRVISRATLEEDKLLGLVVEAEAMRRSIWFADLERRLDAAEDDGVEEDE